MTMIWFDTNKIEHIYKYIFIYNIYLKNIYPITTVCKRVMKNSYNAHIILPVQK